MKIEVGGQIQGISLSSFLQIVQMDKTSCTLKIYSNDEVGFLWIDKGNLVAAETNTTNGLDAVYDIICWNDTVIIIDNTPSPEHNITTPLMTILMEGLRLRDEKAAQIEGGRPKGDGASVDDQIAMNFVMDSPAPPISDEAPPLPPDSHDLPVKEGSEPETESLAPEPQDTDTEETTWDYEYEDLDETPEPRNITRLIFVSFFLLILIGGGALGGFIWYKTKTLEKEYAALTVELRRLRDFSQQKKLLERFLDSHATNRFTPKLTGYLNEANLLIAIDKQIEGMTRDHQFIKKSLGLFKNHLSNYKPTPFLGAITKRMKILPKELDEIDYRRVDEATEEEIDTRLGIYRTYLEDHPYGKYVQQVTNLIASVGDEYYFMIQQGLPDCYQNKLWEPCIAVADTFISEFPNERRFKEVWLIRQKMIDQKKLRRLKKEAATLSPRKAKNLFLTYLQENPNTTVSEEVNEAIINLAQKVEQLGFWEEIRAIATNPDAKYATRIRELDTYLRQYPDGIYANKARDLRDKVEAEYEKSSAANKLITAQLRAQRAERRRQLKEQKILTAQQKAEAEARRKREAIAKLKSRETAFRARLHGLKSRFRDNHNGTVTDKKSGLVWSLLDSKGLGKACMDFKTTKAWAEGLTLGGKSNWRLPTPNELALLYNGKPWYPSSGVGWYWTAQVNTGAWGTAESVVIFDPNQKELFSRESRPLETCGYVHLVRTPSGL